MAIAESPCTLHYGDCVQRSRHYVRLPAVLRVDLSRDDHALCIRSAHALRVLVVAETVRNFRGAAADGWKWCDDLLKQKSDRYLGDPLEWDGDIGFILLLGFVGLSGLVLYALGSTPLMPALLAIHLGSVLTFFLLTPYTKMAHGFYRLAAFVRDAQRKRDVSVVR